MMIASVLSFMGLVGAIQSAPTFRVTAPPPSRHFSSFYKKAVETDGLYILSSDDVPDAALKETALIIHEMLLDVSKKAVESLDQSIHIALIGNDEQTTSIPEDSDLYAAFPGTDWNKRTRGVAATKQRPVVCFGADNVLQLKSDRYKGESIAIHEFAHSLFDFGLAVANPKLKRELEADFEADRKQGLWDNTYSATNDAEYWAEGVQMYFDAARTSSKADGVHNWVGTREDLKKYDPRLYRFIRKTLGDNPWRWNR